MKIENLLVATDFSPSAEVAERAGIRLASDFGARLHVFHALEVPLPIFEQYAVAVPDRFLAEARETARRKLDAVLARAREGGVEGDTLLGEVPAPYAIREHALEVSADLVVVGTEGHTGIQHLLLGSVAEGTVRTAPCSVLAVRQEALTPGAPIVVGTDFSEPSQAAVETACELANQLDAPLHLVHAARTTPPMVGPYEIAAAMDLSEAVIGGAREKLDGVAAACTVGAGITTEVSTLAPQVALAEVARKQAAQLVVVGSRGRTGLKHLVLGSVAERTVRHAPCNVWTVRPTE